MWSKKSHGFSAMATLSSAVSAQTSERGSSASGAERPSACLGRTSSGVVGIGAEAVEREDVDDALLARDQRVHAEQRLGREGELLQAVVEREIEVGEGLEVVPQHRPQPGAVVAREARRQLDRLAPVIGAQLGGDAGEEGVEILDHVEHVVGVEVAQRRRLPP